MRCKEKGCIGVVSFLHTTPLQTGCGGMCTPCYPCNMCGALYSSDGFRMYQRGYDKKPFLKNGEIILEPTEEEEVRSLKVDHMISLFDAFPEEEQKSVLKELEKISKFEHTEDCALGSVPTCTCGIADAKEFLKVHDY